MGCDIHLWQKVLSVLFEQEIHCHKHVDNQRLQELLWYASDITDNPSFIFNQLGLFASLHKLVILFIYLGKCFV